MSRWPVEPAQDTWLSDHQVTVPRTAPGDGPAGPTEPERNRGRTGRLVKVIAVACAAVLVAVAIGAAIVSHLRDRPNDKASPAVPAAPTTAGPTTTLGPLPSPAGGPLVFTGKGSSRTPPFHLDAGLVIFRVEQQGSQRFALDLATAAGRALGRLVHTENGAPHGATADGVAAGAYVLDVTADGSWSVTIEQPKPTSGAPVPLHTAGRGPSLVGPFSAGGKLQFKVHHDGGSTFVIALVDGQDGAPQGLVAATVGGFDGTDVFTLADGLHYADVDADGSWTIDVSAA